LFALEIDRWLTVKQGGLKPEVMFTLRADPQNRDRERHDEAVGQIGHLPL